MLKKIIISFFMITLLSCNNGSLSTKEKVYTKDEKLGMWLNGIKFIDSKPVYIVPDKMMLRVMILRDVTFYRLKKKKKYIHGYYLYWHNEKISSRIYSVSKKDLIKKRTYFKYKVINNKMYIYKNNERSLLKMKILSTDKFISPKTKYIVDYMISLDSKWIKGEYYIINKR